MTRREEFYHRGTEDRAAKLQPKTLKPNIRKADLEAENDRITRFQEFEAIYELDRGRALVHLKIGTKPACLKCSSPVRASCNPSSPITRKEMQSVIKRVSEDPFHRRSEPWI